MRFKTMVGKLLNFRSTYSFLFGQRNHVLKYSFMGAQTRDLGTTNANGQSGSSNGVVLPKKKRKT